MRPDTREYKEKDTAVISLCAIKLITINSCLGEASHREFNILAKSKHESKCQGKCVPRCNPQLISSDNVWLNYHLVCEY